MNKITMSRLMKIPKIKFSQFYICFISQRIRFFMPENMERPFFLNSVGLEFPTLRMLITVIANKVVGNFIWDFKEKNQTYHMAHAFSSSESDSSGSEATACSGASGSSTWGSGAGNAGWAGWCWIWLPRSLVGFLSYHTTSFWYISKGFTENKLLPTLIMRVALLSLARMF